MFRRSAANVVSMSLIAASQAPACTMQILAGEMIENRPVCSANGRFCLVVRWYPQVADFTAERADQVFAEVKPEPIDDSEAPLPEPPTTVTAALYDTSGRSRVLLREISLDVDYAYNVLVSSSGRYVVGFRGLGWGGCGGSSDEKSPLLAIYDRGARVAALTAGDVLNPYDILRLRDSGASINMELRHESESREVVAVRIPAPSDGVWPRFEERRVDLATGALLDAKRDIYPVPRAYAEPSETSGELFARAVRAPLPEFPLIALKARIRGVVRIELLVSEEGAVLDTRVTKPLPFGLDTAAEAAVRQWRFRPYIVDGRPVKTKGEIVFQYKDVDDATWATLTRALPPSD
jgi:TonB family protein